MVRRNKLAFTAASAVGVALLIGLSISTWMFFRERQARNEQERLRRRAETESTKSGEVAQFLKDMLKAVGPSAALGRDQTMLREILDQTAERIEKELANQPEVQAELLNTIGFAYWELGQLQMAAKMYQASLERMRKLWGHEHPQVAATLHNLADVFRRNGQTKEAIVTEREALAINEKLFGQEHAAVAASLITLGSALGEARKFDEAETLLRRALSTSRKLLSDEHPQVALCLSRFGAVLADGKKFSEAETMYREAIAIQTKLIGQKASNLSLKRPELAPNVEMAWTLRYLSSALEEQSRLSEAEGTMDEAIAVISRVVAPNHPDRVLLFEDYIRLHLRHGKLAEAADGLSRVRDNNPDSHWVWPQLAAILVQKGDIALYREHCRRSIERFGDSKIPVIAHRIVKACLILPDSGVDLTIVDRMADVSVSGKTRWGPLGATKALAEYRLGRFASAADWAERTLTNETSSGWVTVQASAALAMARHQLKQNELAQAAWVRAQDDGNKHLPKLDSTSWVDVIIAHALLREAKALIEGASETKG
jgi:tetratricopeptide (TPR) repeat protein